MMRIKKSAQEIFILCFVILAPVLAIILPIKGDEWWFKMTYNPNSLSLYLDKSEKNPYKDYSKEVIEIIDYRKDFIIYKKGDKINTQSLENFLENNREVSLNKNGFLK